MERGKLIQCCISCLSWSPVPLVLTLVFYSYCVYIAELVFSSIKDTSTRILYSIVVTMLMLLFLWTYWKLLVVDVARPSSIYSMPDELHNRLEILQERYDLPRQSGILEIFVGERQLQLKTRDHRTDLIRYCFKCRHVKPDRCHHCSSCGHCVLRFDHHCPFVNRCINFNNYKYFLLFMFYAQVASWYVIATVMPQIVRAFREKLIDVDLQKVHLVAMAVVSFLWIASTIGLLGFHVYLLATNQTSFETAYAPNGVLIGECERFFDGGCKANFVSIFGDDIFLWVFPVFSSKGSGDNFPVFPERKTRDDSDDDL